MTCSIKLPNFSLKIIFSFTHTYSHIHTLARFHFSIIPKRWSYPGKSCIHQDLWNINLPNRISHRVT